MTTAKAAEKPKTAPPAAAPAAQTDPAAQDQGTTQDQGQEQTQTEQPPAPPAAAPPAPPATKAAAPRSAPPAPPASIVRPGAHEGDMELAAVGYRYEMPKALSGRGGADTLMDACETYGINPDPALRPVELAAWKYYQEDAIQGIPGYVQLVTGGGVKLRHYDDPDFPMDRDTEEKLRGIFGAFTIDPATKLPVPVPLPTDLTLPAEAVDGIPRKQDHRFRKGYLREGGKAEAARRAARKSRPKRG